MCYSIHNGNGRGPDPRTREHTMKNGKLSKREMETLNRAWDILSRWTDYDEEHGTQDEYVYDVAMNAVAGLCEFINNYERQ